MQLHGHLHRPPVQSFVPEQDDRQTKDEIEPLLRLRRLHDPRHSLAMKYICEFVHQEAGAANANPAACEVCQSASIFCRDGPTRAITTLASTTIQGTHPQRPYATLSDYPSAADLAPHASLESFRQRVAVRRHGCVSSRPTCLRIPPDDPTPVASPAVRCIPEVDDIHQTAAARPRVFRPAQARHGPARDSPSQAAARDQVRAPLLRFSIPW